jgi:site-specific recombinase XerD
MLVDCHSSQRHKTVLQKFKVIVRAAGLSDRIHLHLLRHSYVSWLVQSSVPLAEVQKILGQASVVTTQIYAHLEYENLRNAVETIQLIDSGVKALPE